MSMTHAQIGVLLRDAMQRVQDTSGPSAAVSAHVTKMMENTEGSFTLIGEHLEKIVTSLGVAMANGYQPTRLPSTVHLAKEIARIQQEERRQIAAFRAAILKTQQEQRARLAALHAGINELLG